MVSERSNNETLEKILGITRTKTAAAAVNTTMEKLLQRIQMPPIYPMGQPLPPSAQPSGQKRLHAPPSINRISHPIRFYASLSVSPFRSSAATRAAGQQPSKLSNLYSSTNLSVDSLQQPFFYRNEDDQHHNKSGIEAGESLHPPVMDSHMFVVWGLIKPTGELFLKLVHPWQRPIYRCIPRTRNEKIWIADDSLASIAGKGRIVLFDGFSLQNVLHDLNSGRTIGTVQHSRGLYILNDDTSGHPNFTYMKYLFPHLFLKIDVSSLSCDECIRAKQHRVSFPSQPYKPTQLFTLIHSDVWGPSKVTTSSGKRWFVTFIDDYTRLTWVYLITDKFEEESQKGSRVPYQSAAGSSPRLQTSLRSRSDVAVLENVEKKNNGDETEVRTETSNNEAEQGHTGKLDKYDPSLDLPIVLRKEMKAFEKNNTWEICALPKGHKPMGCKWVFTLKYKADGTLDRHKARFTTFVKSQGYSQGHSDHILFTKVSETGKIAVLIVYVDDIVLSGDDQAEISQLKQRMGMLGCRLADTPIEFNCKLENSDDQVPVDKEQY
ncbi:reverse transcriptase [Cucumis melo var. makuwa]|uniref:Reverse transcriptase n=1 Tax=Cucumis melo var. makuwa TaxID=1194695 RepID=A0A5A7VHP6_CUCMM|nr:reverse transcriptase [Cucumis melo var. makuwa]